MADQENGQKNRNDLGFEAEGKQEPKDIFDRIMALPGLRIFEGFYKKYKEILLYLFFGALTTVVSIGSFAVLQVGLGMNVLVANVISWILAVTFAFITNRIWVFDAKTEGAGQFLVQMAKFFGGRVFTLIDEEAILFVFITKLGMNSVLIKVIAQVVIVILNYLISKLLVFRKRETES